MKEQPSNGELRHLQTAQLLSKNQSTCTGEHRWNHRSTVLLVSASVAVVLLLQTLLLFSFLDSGGGTSGSATDISIISADEVAVSTTAEITIERSAATLEKSTVPIAPGAPLGQNLLGSDLVDHLVIQEEAPAPVPAPNIPTDTAMHTLPPAAVPPPNQPAKRPLPDGKAVAHQLFSSSASLAASIPPKLRQTFLEQAEGKSEPRALVEAPWEQLDIKRRNAQALLEQHPLLVAIIPSTDGSYDQKTTRVSRALKFLLGSLQEERDMKWIHVLVPASLKALPDGKELEQTFRIHFERGAVQWVDVVHGIGGSDQKRQKDAEALLRHAAVTKPQSAYFLLLNDDITGVVDNFLVELGHWIAVHFQHRQDWSTLSLAHPIPQSDQSQVSAPSTVAEFLGCCRVLRLQDVREFADRTTGAAPPQPQSPPTTNSFLLAAYVSRVSASPSFVHHPPLFTSSLTPRLKQIDAYLPPITAIPSSPEPSTTEKRAQVLEFLSQNRLVFGIPSVYRSANSYILRMLHELLHQIPPEYYPHITVLVLNGNVPAESHQDVALIRKRFRKYMDLGVLHILELPWMYPEMEGPLKQRWDDSEQRIRWRSKQVLDFAYLMDVARFLGAYYVQLEDDVVPSRDYITDMVWWLREYYTNYREWMMLSYYTSATYQDRQVYSPGDFFGFIGQLFRSEDLGALVDYFRTRFDESPVDWLVRDYLVEQQRLIVAHSPSLFQHFGTQSSLEGKMQLVGAASFRGGDLGTEEFLPGSFPSLLASTSTLATDPQAMEVALEFLGKHKIVFGIASVARPQQYLMSTLTVLFESISEREREHLKVVLVNANEPPSGHVELVEQVRNEFGEYLTKENLLVRDIPASHTAPLRLMEEKPGSGWERWLAKLALDAAYLMEQCGTLDASYYVHLEDDATMTAQVLAQIAHTLATDAELVSRKDNDWFSVSFYQRGGASMLGTVIPTRHLSSFAAYLRKHYHEGLPLEQLRDRFATDHQLRQLPLRRGNLFQHYGRKSSFRQENGQQKINSE